MPNLEALEKLADGLENYVKDEWFKYNTYYDTGFARHKCGTAACAAGWAPQLMDDPRLRYVIPEDPERQEYITLDGEEYSCYGWDYYKMMAAYFNIPNGDARDIFESDNYPSGWEATRYEVAAKIRRYIKKYRRV